MKLGIISRRFVSPVLTRDLVQSSVLKSLLNKSFYSANCILSISYLKFFNVSSESIE